MCLAAVCKNTYMDLEIYFFDYILLRLRQAGYKAAGCRSSLNVKTSCSAPHLPSKGLRALPPMRAGDAL